MSSEDETDLLDVRMLHLFDLIYRTHSVTRSAECLGLSQPTASIWLSTLRELFEDQLFVRTPLGMQPTPRADELIKTSREILHSVRQLSARQARFDPATAERQFRICMTDATHITMVPQLFTHVNSVASKISLEAIAICDTTGNQLQSGEADLAIGLLPELESGFYQQILFSQDWICLVNPKHPRVKKKLDLPSYQRESHVGISSGIGHRLLEDTLAERGIERRVLLRLSGFLGLSSIISSTNLIATLPRRIGETLAAQAGLKSLPCPVSIPTFTVKLHWHTRYHNDPGNRWLRGVCAKLFQRSAPASD